jgi:hypothetical protein
MKLTRIRDLGRHKNPETGRFVNVKKGTRVGRSTDVIFYLYRGTRIIIDDADFYNNWKK